MQLPGYPIHWIFDYFPAFSEEELRAAFLLFDGKKMAEIRFLMDLTPETTEELILSIRDKTNMGGKMRLSSIESGTFYRKWGFIRKTFS